MQMKVKTRDGTISASYLHDNNDNATGIHIGIAGYDSVASLEYSNMYGGICLIINQEELENRGIRLVSRVGGWNGRDVSV